MNNYSDLSVKHGVNEEYKTACKLESEGRGNGFRHDIEKALDSAEHGNAIEESMAFFCNNPPMPASHTEAGLRYRG